MWVHVKLHAPGGPIQGTARQVLLERSRAPYRRLHEERVCGSVLEHWTDQDEPAGSHPPILGQLVQAHTTPPPTRARSRWSQNFSRRSHDPQRRQPQDVGAGLRDARVGGRGAEFRGQRAEGGQVIRGPPEIQGQDGENLQGLWHRPERQALPKPSCEGSVW